MHYNNIQYNTIYTYNTWESRGNGTSRRPIGAGRIFIITIIINTMATLLACVILARRARTGRDTHRRGRKISLISSIGAAAAATEEEEEGA